MSDKHAGLRKVTLDEIVRLKAKLAAAEAERDNLSLAFRAISDSADQWKEYAERLAQALEFGHKAMRIIRDDTSIQLPNLNTRIREAEEALAASGQARKDK